MTEKLSIANEMMQFDRKNRGFYDSLTDEERKKFSNYLMIRWGSAVQGSSELQEFYLIATNERLNKHFFAINKHPKLQWLMLCAASPGLGKQFHQWIPHLSGKVAQLKESPKEKEVNIQDLRKLKNKGYTDELKAEASMNALQKKLFTKAKQDNPAFNTYQKLADRDRADLAFEIQLKTISDNATKKP
jgi:hypothetical protein